MSEEDTQTNWRSLIAQADGPIDKALIWTVASKWSPVIVALFAIICMFIGAWVRGAP